MYTHQGNYSFIPVDCLGFVFCKCNYYILNQLRIWSNLNMYIIYHWRTLSFLCELLHNSSASWPVQWLSGGVSALRLFCCGLDPWLGLTKDCKKLHQLFGTGIQGWLGGSDHQWLPGVVLLLPTETNCDSEGTFPSSFQENNKKKVKKRVRYHEPGVIGLC